MTVTFSAQLALKIMYIRTAVLIIGSLKPLHPSNDKSLYSYPSRLAASHFTSSQLFAEYLNPQPSLLFTLHVIMRPYAIYEHPDFSLSTESVSTLQKIAAALTAVAASSAAVYGYIVRNGTR